MEETQFNDKYWHSNTEMVTVVNPRSEDYVFQATSETGIDTATGKMRSEARHYKVPAGGTERFPGTIANMYLDQMAKLVAQDDDKIQYMIDFSLKAQYYDQLTVSVEDLIHSFVPTAGYLDRPEHEETSATPTPVTEVPFASVTPEPKKLGRPPKATTEA